MEKRRSRQSENEKRRRDAPVHFQIIERLPHQPIGAPPHYSLQKSLASLFDINQCNKNVKEEEKKRVNVPTSASSPPSQATKWYSFMAGDEIVLASLGAPCQRSLMSYLLKSKIRCFSKSHYHSLHHNHNLHLII